jgi:hypothetical protein
MILYLRDPKNHTQKLLGTINSLSNVEVYKNQLTKIGILSMCSHQIESVAFLYALTKLRERI